MPKLISTYSPPLGFGHPHVQTIYPTVFRRLPMPPYRRERLATPDGDFLDIDWWENAPDKPPGNQASPPLVLIAHGMEGSSQAIYVRGMARSLHAAGWDIGAWNMRGCGGESNKLKSFYHSGKTDDLHAVVEYARQRQSRNTLALVGFSLGGNVLLKYLGERGEKARGVIHGAVALSVPCDLEGCATALSKPGNALYLRRFLLSFRAKIREKMRIMPGRIDDAGYGLIRDFRDFDNRYTAPDFGYASAEAYWRANSSLGYLKTIAVPTLLLTSRDDPFLSPGCYPIEAAENHAWLTLEITERGGHCGFVAWNREKEYYSEFRARDFLERLP